MLDSFRRLSKSKIGTGIMVAVLLIVLASFALGDVTSLKNGNFGLGSNTLAKVGAEQVSDRDVSRAMEQALNRLRQQNPAATSRDLAGEFDPIVNALIEADALMAFAKDQGMVLSKALVDSEIANIPGTRGLDGRFSDAGYQAFLAKQQMSDSEVRRIISGSLIQRLILAPAATNARLSLGMTTPYASMLLEQRQGEVALVPVAAFAAGLKPTDAHIASYYAANRARYMVPEQRSLRLARFGPEQLASTAPSEQEITAYYNANPAAYSAKEIRVLSQAVVQDPKVAASIAASAKAGSFVNAATPAGLTAQDVTVGPQTREQFNELAGDKVAAAVFAPGVKAGSIIGPIQSSLGWHVVRVESVLNNPGKTLAAAHAEIAAKLSTNKRKTALADTINRVQDAVDDGQSFADIVAKNKLTATETPLLTAQGISRADPQFKLPPELAGALKSGFELAPQDAPVVETLPGDTGFALVSSGKVVPAAPAPLDQIKAKVDSDWTLQQASARAKAAVASILAKTNAGASLAQAVAGAGATLPPPRPVSARRIDLQQAPPAMQEALRMLFTTAPGKSQSVPVPAANAIGIIHVTKIVPGNAMIQPTLITQVQTQFQNGATEEYAQQFVAAASKKVGVVRNEAAIAAARQRLTATADGAQ